MSKQEIPEGDSLARRWCALAPDDGRGRARLLAEAVLARPPDERPAAREALLALGISSDCPELLDRALAALERGQLVRAWRLAALLDDGLLFEPAAAGRFAPTPSGDDDHAA